MMGASERAEDTANVPDYHILFSLSKLQEHYSYFAADARARACCIQVGRSLPAYQQ